MFTVGERLKAERERLGLSQTALGEVCGVQKRTQINYEKGDRSPDALYLAAFHAAGGDVMWVVIGDRTAPALLPPEERELLDYWRTAPLAGRAAAVAALTAGPAPAMRQKVKQKISGKAGHQVVGINTGDVNGNADRAGDKRQR